MMKNLLSVKPILTTALLMLLSSGIIAGIGIHGCAGAPVKNPTVYVNGSGSVELVWKSGTSEVYSADVFVNLGGLDTATFTPSRGWHIETVLFDGNSQVILDEDGFSLINIAVKRMITVTFVENGGVDDVDTGSNTAANPDPDVGLIFDSVLIDGYAYAFLFGLEQDDQISESWDIQTTATFEDNITIFLVCNLADLPSGMDPNDLALWKTEWILGDVNLDGIVDGEDQSIIANVNPDEPIDPIMDLNYDGVVNNEDVTICSHNHGLESIWVQLESWIVIEGDFVYVYGATSSLSIFGVTKRK
ncbi:MAG: hypothetical protein JSV64_01340 [Candidatus Bathyarchaeota archaeon]|nr:MAG: hypothetical protein JSV64_01340 [Candidatus Bathyarchaeota archaeon]